MEANSKHIKALKDVEEAIGRIDEHEKTAYLEAVRRAPHLVATESDPLRFLRFTNFNAAAAAQGVVKYWKRRADVFGPNRAFLPLSLTGNGAMSKEAIECLKSSQVVRLPHNKHGRAVSCCDQSRRSKARREILSQCSFFNGQMMSEDEASQVVGYEMLVPVYGKENNDKFASENMNAILNTFPVRLQCWHFVNCLPEWKEDSSRFEIIAKGIKVLIERMGKNVSTYFHFSQKKKQDIMKELEAHGYERTGVPSSLGGSWSYECFADWLEQKGERDQMVEAGSIPFTVNRVNGSQELVCESDAFHSNEAKTGEPHSKKRAKKDDAIYVLNWHREVAKVIGTLPQEYVFAYKQALHHAPEEVKKISVDLFLRTEDFNPYLAAHRIARYWQLRAESFGSRKFLPMQQTGEGALGYEELQMLRMNFINLLPNDTEGCPVIWYNGSRQLRVSKKMTKETKHRCLFYMFSLLAENKKSQSEGSVLLNKLNSPIPCAHTDIIWVKRLVYALPLRFKAVHLISHSTVSAEDQAEMDFGDKIYTHVADTMSELSSQVQSYGIDEAGLPKSLSGEWDTCKFLTWQEVRARMEWQLPQAFGRMDSSFFTLPGIKPYMLLPDEQKAERSRRLNVIHCRRKRDRLRLTTEGLTDQIDELKQEREALKNQNKKLQDLLAWATDMVSTSHTLVDLSVVTSPINETRNIHPPTNYAQHQTNTSEASCCDLHRQDYAGSTSSNSQRAHRRKGSSGSSFAEKADGATCCRQEESNRFLRHPADLVQGRPMAGLPEVTQATNHIMGNQERVYSLQGTSQIGLSNQARLLESIPGEDQLSLSQLANEDLDLLRFNQTQRDLLTLQMNASLRLGAITRLRQANLNAQLRLMELGGAQTSLLGQNGETHFGTALQGLVAVPNSTTLNGDIIQHIMLHRALNSGLPTNSPFHPPSNDL